MKALILAMILITLPTKVFGWKAADPFPHANDSCSALISKLSTKDEAARGATAVWLWGWLAGYMNGWNTLTQGTHKSSDLPKLPFPLAALDLKSAGAALTGHCRANPSEGIGEATLNAVIFPALDKQKSLGADPGQWKK
ncbi:MAG: hypothetical protein VYB37_06575 [Pseudomonadota bacterium]|jgi:hypothetical protein|nr:hypothetical protein [Pseudomonadota bacterium]